MIDKVHIQNFKTLKDLSFPCTRMNLFIGDTSTGKTNILEALTFFSRGVLKDNMFDQRLIRYDKPEDLFPMHDLSEPMVVDIAPLKFGMRYDRGMFNIQVTQRKNLKAKPTFASTPKQTSPSASCCREQARLEQFGRVVRSPTRRHRPVGHRYGAAGRA